MPVFLNLSFDPPMMILYGIPNCNTVKKARTWLDAQGVPYKFHDYKKDGLSREKLDQWLTQIRWDTVVNRAGTTWRRLPEEQKSQVTDAGSAADLLLSYTSAIKRPIIEDADGKVLAVGFSEKEYEAKFA